MMDKLEKFWRDAPAGYTVCAETGVTKNMVLNAIIDGAKDLDALRKAVHLCRDDSCSAKNPSGRGCSENAEVLLSIYAPIIRLNLKIKMMGLPLSGPIRFKASLFFRRPL